MPTVKITERLLDECKEHLQVIGAYQDDLTHKQIIEACLSCLLYDTPELDEGRRLGHRLLKKALGERDMSHIPRSALGGEEERLASPELLSSLRDAVRDVNPTYEASENVDRTSDDSLPEQVISEVPPWEQLERIPIEKLKMDYPRHPLMKWSEQSDLHQYAVEAAFAVTSIVLHKTGVLTGTAEKLLRTFKNYVDIRKAL